MRTITRLKLTLSPQRTNSAHDILKPHAGAFSPIYNICRETRADGCRVANPRNQERKLGLSICYVLASRDFPAHLMQFT